ncbi:MAG: pentapeptide repeat-containing protein [Candidatus Endonucleobacter bathymodioli]|uniref:Pentapeptide repeat-containing protein n=1 Tax=Candidatus Endonucleibacter bathymodioli TaxID=539814 RepID=A0AA90SCH1_9GAMM|nr:pentapeptide repeat-containing protein [Candidatus Endonucleobacter bathymodioli]
MRNGDKPDNKKNRNAHIKDAEIKSSLKLGRPPILDVDSIKTTGLTQKSDMTLKNILDYMVKSQNDIQASLYHEKKRSKSIQSLLKSLHPGYTVPHGAFFQGLTLSGRDLKRVRFTESLFRNTKLRECALRDVIFTRCDLSGADFRKSDLTNVTFNDCNLNGADLRQCNLFNARIIDCNLFATNLDHSTLDQTIIDNCSMKAMSLYKTSCKGTKLFNSQVVQSFLASTDMSHAEIKNMLFRDCTLNNTHFDSATLDDCCFRSCDSFEEGPIFSNSSMNNILITDCELDEPQFSGTNMSNSRLDRVHINTALFDGAIFDNVIFNKGIMTDCYSCENAPIFTKCRLDHLVIDNADFCNANFNESSFICTTILASDFANWEINNSHIDEESTIDTNY